MKKLTNDEIIMKEWIMEELKSIVTNVNEIMKDHRSDRIFNVNQSPGYKKLSESQHQIQFFQWAGCVGKVGFASATEWLLSAPTTKERDSPYHHLPVGNKVGERAVRALGEAGRVAVGNRSKAMLKELREALRDKSRGDDRLEWMFAIPNGGSRGSTRKGRAITGAKMKAEGVKRGVSDIMIPVPVVTEGNSFHGMFIEMKRFNNGRLSREQKKFRDYAIGQNYHCVTCYGYMDAVNEVLKYFGI